MDYSTISVRKLQLIFILTAFTALMGIVICLKYNQYLPEAYIISVVCLFICLFAALRFQFLAPVYPLFLIIYANAILSIFALRYGLFHGDSQIDLMYVLNIIKYHYILSPQAYSMTSSPLIHIFSSVAGILVGRQDIQNIYSVVIWVPSLIGVISSLVIFITVKKVTNEVTGLLTAIIWISLPFVSRWLIQFTRTTIAILFILLLGFLIVTKYKKMMGIEIYIVILVTTVALIMSHPVVSFFALLSLTFVLLFQMMTPVLNHLGITEYLNINLPTKGQISPLLVMFTCILLISYWIYMGYIFYPFIDVFHEYTANLQNLGGSIFGQVVTNQAQSSFSATSNGFKLFGLSRVALFVLTAALGLLFLLQNKNPKTERHFNKGIVGSLAIFGLLFMVGNLIMGVASTSSYRTVVYASAWLILTLGYFVYKTVGNPDCSKITKMATSFALVVLIVPAPFFLGEVVLPSDWIYSPDPIAVIDYQHGENQRFLEYYHFTVPFWIEKYTDVRDVFWADGTHCYSAIKGYGERQATFSAIPIRPEGIDIEGFGKIGANYVFVNNLMRRSLLIPYGLPASYPGYNFDPLEVNPKSTKIYDSRDANLYKINGI